MGLTKSLPKLTIPFPELEILSATSSLRIVSDGLTIWAENSHLANNSTQVEWTRIDGLEYKDFKDNIALEVLNKLNAREEKFSGIKLFLNQVMWSKTYKIHLKKQAITKRKKLTNFIKSEENEIEKKSIPSHLSTLYKFAIVAYKQYALDEISKEFSLEKFHQGIQGIIDIIIYYSNEGLNFF